MLLGGVDHQRFLGMTAVVAAIPGNPDLATLVGADGSGCWWPVLAVVAAAVEQGG